MSPRVVIAFLVTFVAVYVTISQIDNGSIYWIGLIGSLIGALLAMVMVNHIRRTGSSDTNH